MAALFHSSIEEFRFARMESRGGIKPLNTTVELLFGPNAGYFSEPLKPSIQMKWSSVFFVPQTVSSISLGFCNCCKWRL